MFQCLNSLGQVGHLATEISDLGLHGAAGFSWRIGRGVVEDAPQVVGRPAQALGQIFQGVTVALARSVVVLELANGGLTDTGTRNKILLRDSEVSDTGPDGFGHSSPVVTHRRLHGRFRQRQQYRLGDTDLN